MTDPALHQLAKRMAEKLKLPEWPDKPEPVWMGIDGGPLVQATVNWQHERARAEAAIARLKVALALLQDIEINHQKWCPGPGVCDCGCVEMRQRYGDVLSAIGPLPP